MELFKTKLVKKEQVAPDVLQMKFELQDNKQLNFTAGQYLILMLGQERRLFSIASASYQKDNFELLVRLLPEGVASNYFRALKIEEFSYFQGPAGFFVLKPTEKPKIFLATGTGIAPIRSQIFSYLEPGGKADLFLFWGLKRRGDVYLFDELKYLKQSFPNFNFQICLDLEQDFGGLDVDHFVRGRADKGFLDFIKEGRVSKQQLNDYEYYLCAGREIVEALKTFLAGLGVNKENVFFDKF